MVGKIKQRKYSDQISKIPSRRCGEFTYLSRRSVSCPPHRLVQQTGQETEVETSKNCFRFLCGVAVRRQVELHRFRQVELHRFRQVGRQYQESNICHKAEQQLE